MASTTHFSAFRQGGELCPEVSFVDLPSTVIGEYGLQYQGTVQGVSGAAFTGTHSQPGVTLTDIPQINDAGHSTGALFPVVQVVPYQYNAQFSPCGNSKSQIRLPPGVHMAPFRPRIDSAFQVAASASATRKIGNTGRKRKTQLRDKSGARIPGAEKQLSKHTGASESSFSCFNIGPPIKRTHSVYQTQNRRALSEIGGQCFLCQMLKKQVLSSSIPQLFCWPWLIFCKVLGWKSLYLLCELLETPCLWL